MVCAVANGRGSAFVDLREGFGKLVLALPHKFRSCVSFSKIEIEGQADSTSPLADLTSPAVRAQVNLHIVNPTPRLPHSFTLYSPTMCQTPHPGVPLCTNWRATSLSTSSSTCRVPHNSPPRLADVRDHPRLPPHASRGQSDYRP